MKTEVVLNGSTAANANYVGWSPRPAKVRLSDTTGATGPVTVTLRNQRTNVGGQVVFSTAAAPTPASTLQLTLPLNGSPVDFFVAGKFGSPSTNDKDAAIEVIDGAGHTLSLLTLMVRIRKDAAKLTTTERDRFLTALATLNNRGMGRFTDILTMHTQPTLDESHGSGPPQFPQDPGFRDGFLPWHRAYLLDLERELQGIDISVALPYWRFDKPAPQLFTADFLGEPRTGSSVRFAASNPLHNWTVNSRVGFQRDPRFSFATRGAQVASEATTLSLGNTFSKFTAMERDPHNLAHGNFSGPINNPATAPGDPLFFLLHANVDRLWAQWQFLNKLFDPAKTNSYSFRGSAGSSGATRVGHNLADTLWPWNGNHTFPRPTFTPPSSGMPASTIANAPPITPAVRDMLDYQGHVTAGLWHGFDYDDVIF
jgi:tyrosinase